MSGTFSFEYFPPKTAEQRQRLQLAREKLSALGPAYCSVTFGAGGSTLMGTRQTVLAIHEEDNTEAAPHLSCMGGDEEEIRELLLLYRDAGIRRLVALRGDRPSGLAAPGPFTYARDLVEFIRRETGDHFHIEVACYPEYHPEADSPSEDLAHFADKVAAGANAAITQYFFNADSYFRFVDAVRAAGIEVPITPGVMPITNYRQLARFSDMCGAEIPRWLRGRLADLEHDKRALRSFGEDVVTQLCQRLLDGGAPGIHFYTLNRARATSALWRNLGLPVPG